MANSNSNSNFNLVFLCCLVFSSVVLSNANSAPSNDVASSICPKTRNVSLCWSLLKPMGSIDARKVANYTFSLAYTSAGKCLDRAQRLEAAETANPELKKRYSQCLKELDFVMWDIERAKEALANGGNILFLPGNVGTETATNNCLKTFKHLPREPSNLPEMAKNLRDIWDVVVRVSTLITEDDY